MATTAPLADREKAPFLQRMMVSARDRASMYQKLVVLLDNNVLLVGALQELFDVYSQDGRRVGGVATFLQHCRRTVANGRAFSEAVAPWVSPVEASIIAAGERSGTLREAFKDATDLITGVSKIKWLVVGGTIYPALLAGVIGYILYIIQGKLVPSLEKVAPPETWPGAAAVMYDLSRFTSNFGIPLVVFSIALIVAAIVSLPRLTGNLRYHLDRVPPWSVYRQVQGSTLLLTVGTLIKSGIKLHDALLLLRENANPYLTERLDAVILGTTKGLNFGEALEAAEFRFPDIESIRFVRILARREGFDTSLINYAREYRELVVTRVKATMVLFFVAGLFGAGACAGLIVFASTDIQNAIEASTQQY